MIVNAFEVGAVFQIKFNQLKNKMTSFTAADATAAAKRLLNSDNVGDAVAVGGASKTVFKLGDQYSIRLLRRDRDDSLLTSTKAVSLLGLTPEFVAGDETAIIQKWADIVALPTDWAQDVEWCRKVFNIVFYLFNF